MACCIIAAYLAALAMAKLRQWAEFVGIVAPPEGEIADTIYRRAWSWLGRRFARRNDPVPVLDRVR